MNIFGKGPKSKKVKLAKRLDYVDGSMETERKG